MTGKPVTVNFPKMFEHCVTPLIDSFGVVAVLYDRWSSIHQSQTLREKGIESHQVGVRWRDFNQTRLVIEAGQFKIPKPEITLNQFRQLSELREQAVRGKPVLHMALQIFTVRQVGKNVVKPLNGTDDLWRTGVLAAHWFYIEKNGPRMASFMRRTRRGGHMSVGVVQHKSVGIGGGHRQDQPVTSNTFGAYGSRRLRRVT
jgi:hypothetical protein